MLGAFANAFRTPDLRRKLLFVLFIIAIFRLGSQVPAPGVNVANVQTCLDDVGNSGIYSLINLFSGGALLQLTIFALGIMPYITASIILQLLVVVIPRLEALKKEGQSGQTKITQYTRYLTLGLAVLQATGIVALARSGNLLQGCDEPPAAQRQHGHLPGHGRHHDRRHRRHHVARRADHRARRRQRHVHPDLHPGRGHLPDLPVGGEEHQGLVGLRHRGGHRPRDRRGRHLHRAGPAPHPGAVRPPDGGPQDVRRQLDLHPAQGQPGRRHPGHLRLVAALPARDGGAVPGGQRCRLGAVGSASTSCAATTRST